MDDQLINRLCALNTDFYQKTASSFSSTRRNSWPGWERLADIVAGRSADSAHAVTPESPIDALAKGSEPRIGAPTDAPERTIHIVDLACGNMRFETFLESRLTHASLSFTAVDNCEDFPPTEVSSPCDFVKADLIEELKATDPSRMSSLPEADLAVSFGFAHHIPGKELRVALIERIVGLLAPGGIAAISFWNFAQNPEMAQRAEETTARARKLLQLPELEEGDYILGWQNETDAFRYCHSFSSKEIDELIRATQGTARLIDRFEADGRTGNLNTYLVFQRER